MSSNEPKPTKTQRVRWADKVSCTIYVTPETLERVRAQALADERSPGWVMAHAIERQYAK